MSYVDDGYGNDRPYGAYGEFLDTPEMTPEQWAAYDDMVAEEMALAEQAHWEEEQAYWDLYFEPADPE